MPRHVAVTGASGFIGSALVPRLIDGGWRVTRLVRRAPAPGEVAWDPAAGRLDPAHLEGVDAVVHLAGESIGQRWTAERKRRIRDSRVLGTRLLGETLARLRRRPHTLVSVSAVGIYGDRGDEVLTEASSLGRPDDFLVRVATEWEAATEPARAAGIRVVLPRLGEVLDRRGGALAQLLPPFQLGVGGRLGSGRQWVSWVALEDALAIILYAISAETLAGAVNATSPEPVTNREFTAVLGRTLSRPTVVAVPAVALRLLFGEMADGVLLASTRAVPARLTREGFRFRYARLEEALRVAVA